VSQLIAEWSSKSITCVGEYSLVELAALAKLGLVSELLP